jgi:2-C-methyl-D-erythritol 2,4-cyclodiphosphate synthase
MIRIGHGFDVHKFGGEQPLMLGGVHVPHKQGLIAHSDGDVVLHAISDALLGALALGDIGKHFPDTDPEFKGADSRALLRHCMDLVVKRGYHLGNIYVTFIAQTPKLAPYIDAM